MLRSDFRVLLTNFFEYFRRNYLGLKGTVRYEMYLWNCGDLRNKNLTKTNKEIERWHSVFKNSFSLSKYFYEFLSF